jgi:hypothetical protein
VFWESPCTASTTRAWCVRSPLRRHLCVLVTGLYACSGYLTLRRLVTELCCSVPRWPGGGPRGAHRPVLRWRLLPGALPVLRGRRRVPHRVLLARPLVVRHRAGLCRGPHRRAVQLPRESAPLLLLLALCTFLGPMFRRGASMIAHPVAAHVVGCPGPVRGVQGGAEYTQVRVVQGKEPPHFCAIFKVRLHFSVALLLSRQSRWRRSLTPSVVVVRCRTASSCTRSALAASATTAACTSST